MSGWSTPDASNNCGAEGGDDEAHGGERELAAVLVDGRKVDDAARIVGYQGLPKRRQRPCLMATFSWIIPCRCQRCIPCSTQAICQHCWILVS